MNGFIGLIQKSEYDSLIIIDPCSNISTNLKSIATLNKGNLYLNILDTDIYFLVGFLCVNQTISLDIHSESQNPYGKVPGELIYLIPVIFYVALFYHVHHLFSFINDLGDLLDYIL